MKIGFFGDSITEGCFEILTINGEVEILRDKSSCYATRLSNRLKEAYPDLHLEFFNAGISGNATADGLKRLETEVLAQNPDLMITCFGLNDVYYRDADVFSDRLKEIFLRLRNENITVVYMTPNMLNTYLSPNVHERVIETAKDCADCQNGGVLDGYMEKAKQVAKECGVYVVDAYAKWKELYAYGVDTTALLCNAINHPTRKMHALFSDMLFDCIEQNHLIKE